MILYTRVTQENKENADLNDTMIPADIIKIFNETAHDQLIYSRDTSHEARTHSETTLAIVLTAHTHQVVFDLEIDVHV